MFRSAVLLSVLGFSGAANALMCNYGDSIVGSNFRNEFQACTGSGYCNAYGYNPSNGNYEYFYGYHSSCPGRQERRVEEMQCQNPNGTRYTIVDYGYWSSCQIQ